MKLNPEKIFFGSSRQEIESLFGVNDIKEIGSKEEVTLPQPLFEYAKAKIADTIADGHENHAFLGMTGMNLNVLEESKGTKFDFSLGEATSGSEKGFLERMYMTYIAKPVLFDFHTHPSFSIEQFRENKVKSATLFNKYKLNLQKCAIISNINASHFSETDLQYLERHRRYIRSMILGTNNGLVCLVNHEYTIPIIDFSFESNKYQKANAQPLESFVNALSARVIMQTDIDVYNNQVDHNLLKFCNSLGFYCFRNYDKNSPELKRVF